jgi:uncharacterized Zn-finger protein
LKGLKTFKVVQEENEGQIACGICSNIFASKFLLKRHLVTHESVSMKKELTKEEIACESCGKMFRSRTFLKRHAVAHSKERPFQCDMCHNNFK